MSNPLAKFFRQPAIHLPLLSRGKFYYNNALNLPANGEVPVYPMTAIDEITYRTPDALFNGSAIVDVIKSCVPAIQDPWEMPVIDLDALLIGIRIASYGHSMDFESTCPHCGHENEFELDLRSILDQLEAPEYDQALQVAGLEIYCKPLSYRELDENNKTQFNEQRALSAISAAQMPEDEKLKRIQEAFSAIKHLTVSAIANSIAAIKTPDTLVTDKQHIEEFVAKADSATFNVIRDRVIELRQKAEIKPLVIQCQNEECNQTYETPFTLDVSNFFGSDS